MSASDARRRGVATLSGLENVGLLTLLIACSLFEGYFTKFTTERSEMRKKIQRGFSVS
jgi:hypothetical protein